MPSTTCRYLPASLRGAATLAHQQKLTPVLATFTDPQPVPIFAVTASARHRLPKIKACLDYWAQ